MASIILGSRRFTYRVNRKPIRSLRLSLKSASSFAISAPSFVSDFAIHQFILKHQAWIIKNSALIRSFPRLARLKHLSILGQNYSLIYQASTQDSIFFNHLAKTILVSASSFSQNHLKKLFQKHFPPLALKLIQKELSSLQTEIKFKFNRVSVKNQRSRFGSCSSAGNLNFNWQIIFFPYPQFRHLILHEVCHLLEKNHQQQFWDTLARYDPNWRAHNRWLRLHGSKCYLIQP